MAKGQFLPGPGDEVEDIEFEVDTNGPQQKTSADNLLDELMLELNDTSDKVSLSVYRQTGNGQESMQFVESMPPDKYGYTELLNYIRECYGAGDYRLQVRQNGKLKANKLVQIAKRISQPQNNPQNSGNENALLHAIQGMQEQIAQQNQVIARVMQQPQGNNKKEFLEEMMLYKQLFAGDTSKQSGGVGELLQSVDALKSLGINVGIPSPDDKEEGFVDMIDKVSPLLMQVMSQPQPQVTPQPQVNPTPNPSERDPKMFQQMMIKAGIGQLVKSAQKNLDPSLSAEYLTNLYEKEMIEKFLMAPQALDQAAKMDPRVTDHVDWFNNLKEHIKALYGQPSKFADQYSEFTNEADDAITVEEPNDKSEPQPNGDDI